MAQAADLRRLFFAAFVSFRFDSERSEQKVTKRTKFQRDWRCVKRVPPNSQLSTNNSLSAEALAKEDQLSTNDSQPLQPAPLTERERRER